MRITPPAIFKESKVTPNASNKYLPIYAKAIKIKKAIIVLFIAISVLFLNFASSVKLKKNGKFPIVSIVMKNNTKEFINVFSMLLFHIFSWQ